MKVITVSCVSVLEAILCQCSKGEQAYYFPKKTLSDCAILLPAPHITTSCKEYACTTKQDLWLAK